MPEPKDYLQQLRRLIDNLDLAGVERLIALLRECWSEDRRVFLVGNGGSSATASHIVNDLQKCLQLETGKALKALCLSDCTPLVMAWANDTDYSNIFAPQIECWGEPGDLLIAISGSGNSPNVLEAVNAAQRRGVRVFGLAGFMGGELAASADECLVVPSTDMQQIEDVHMIVLHMVFSALRERLKAETKAQ